ncbi:MAG: hypothetical protein QRY72_04115 [Candidatus Rhabdochlamydia sp.]
MTTEYQSKNLDHLGIVSQICDDIGLQDKPERAVLYSNVVYDYDAFIYRYMKKKVGI